MLLHMFVCFLHLQTLGCDAAQDVELHEHSSEFGPEPGHVTTPLWRLAHTRGRRPGVISELNHHF